jgi:hypothetical protein
MRIVLRPTIHFVTGNFDMLLIDNFRKLMLFILPPNNVFIQSALGSRSHHKVATPARYSSLAPRDGQPGNSVIRDSERDLLSRSTDRNVS